MTPAIRLVIPVGAIALAFALTAQQTPAQFEAVSIRPVEDCSYGRGGGDTGDTKKAGPTPAGLAAPSPERLYLCGPVLQLITVAYVLPKGKTTAAAPTGAFLIPDVPIEGGPEWVRGASYALQAKADRPVDRNELTGRMLRELLADRFKLKIHEESRDVPSYAITVAKGGPKLPRSTCTPPPFGPDAPPLPAGATPCAMEGAQRKGSVLAVDRYAKTVGEFSQMLSLDRPVVDRTGLAGIYDFHFEIVPDETTPLFLRRVQNLPDTGAVRGAAASSIFTAFQEQLGLKLESVKAPKDYLVIDSISRPSEN